MDTNEQQTPKTHIVSNFSQKKKGKFIVFEGIDGSGKGTQVLKAASFLFSCSKDIDIYLTREPTRDFKVLRESMAQGMDVKDKAEWYADVFVQDRKNHIENYIIPNINKGVTVICDRYKHSTLTYQHSQGIPMDKLLALHKAMLVPDLTLIFDCPSEIAFQRRQSDNPTDVFDKDLNFQEKLRDNYKSMVTVLKDEPIVLIDASRSIEDVFNDVQQQLLKVLQEGS